MVFAYVGLVSDFEVGFVGFWFRDLCVLWFYGCLVFWVFCGWVLSATVGFVVFCKFD